MRFGNPHFLWLLLVIPPALVLFFWWGERARQKLLTQFIEARLLSSLTVGISPVRRKIRFALLILSAALLIAAIARPQYGYDKEEVRQTGLDIVVAVDTSKSMLTADIAPNRLERAKLAALELMQHAGSDRLGLVAFAGDAFLECPLTVDNTAFQQSVRALNVNSIPQGGTALAAAIDTALTAFKEQDHYKALVLLTDGEDNANETAALEAARNAAKAGLKIFTVGIGTAAGDLIRVPDAKGNSDYVRDAQGNVVKSHLNEPLAATNRHGHGRILPAIARRGHDGRALRSRAGAAAEVGRHGKNCPAVSRAVSVAAGGGDGVAARGNVLAGEKANEGGNIHNIQHPTATAALLPFLMLPAATKASPSSRVAGLSIGKLHQRAPGIFEAGGNADKRLAPGVQRRRRGVSRDEF